MDTVIQCEQTTGQDYSRENRLVAFILAHGVLEAKYMPETNKIRALNWYTYRNERGIVEALESWEEIEPTVQAVKRWLGY